jgi:hypothetical protein
MAVGSTQPVTETSTWNLPPLASQFPRKCGNLYISQLSGPPWPITGIALPSLHASDISDILYKTLYNHEVLLLSFVNGLCYIPYILESNPHPFYSFRGLKNQMRIRIECGLDSRSRAGVWQNDRAGVRAVRTIQGGKNEVRIRFKNIRYTATHFTNLHFQ